jgi:hypothetical protein
MSLTLFKNITDELTQTEKEKFVPMLIDTLNGSHTENRMTGKAICGWFKSCGHNVSEVRLRKMINYIRVLNLIKGHVVIGAGNGYFITSDPHIVQEQIESLQGRIDSMKAVIDSLTAEKINLQHKKSA